MIGVKKSRVLLVDDDEQLVDILSLKLERAGFAVDQATTAERASELALNKRYDAFILDVVMPKRLGSDLVRDFRSQGIFTPTIMLSGKHEKTVIVKSLEAGADDYLTKPFSSNELTSRLKALIRRNQGAFSSRWIKHNDIELDLRTNTLYYADKSVVLTKKEAQLLKRLMHDAPELVPREVLLHDVWGIDTSHTSNRLEVHIKHLRNKLEQLGIKSRINTVRGIGYFFK